MYHTSIDYLDRLRAKNIFQGTSHSLLGVIGSLMLIAALLAFYLPTIISFLGGSMYFQSEFSLQQTPFGNITLSKDFKAAIVFYNKTDNKVANHTIIRQYMSIVTYLDNTILTILDSTNSNRIKSDTIMANCDLTYFQDTVNPPENFTDCVTFPKNSKV